MGGWQLKLFCCDWDLDLIQDLNGDCGLYDLEVKHGRKGPPLEPGTNTIRQDEHRRWAANSKAIREEDVVRRPELPKKDNTEDKEIAYSLFEKLCSHPDRVRKHLDATGLLDETFKKANREAIAASPSWIGDCYGPAYRICILGACGMSLGAKISKQHKNAMRKYYKNCGLMRDAMVQIEAALDEVSGYTEGKCWDFGSPGQQENMAAGGCPKEDRLYPGCGLTNVWVPDHGRQKGEMQLAQKNVIMGIAYHKPSIEDLAQTLASLFFDPYAHPKTNISSTKADSKPEDFMEMARQLIEENNKPRNRKTGEDTEDKKEKCGSCGAETTADGKPLLSCGKCKKAKYCSVACQKKEWKYHKQFCGVFDPFGTGQKVGKHGVVSFLKPT
ncbi:hypothetical protein PRZ48_009015 [Zasmidium cellare]|uniref:MYND-type domain-containing protein n=1 Tax=Zasmidium cellare TaxID=395010 RepID=A0ABR0EI03_ZASCE|nr:hypothetical protein PRZ48_009015 [Zasmidium cellare]